jgi:hypothetical protein
MTASVVRAPVTWQRGDLDVPAAPRSGVLPTLVATTVCLLPLLSPAGPGNSALADLGICGCITVALLWVSRARLTISFPYVVGVTAMMVGGAFAATAAGAPLGSGLVIAQDLLLLLWGVTLALGRHDPAIIGAATTAWCRTAVVFATVGVAAYLVGFAPISGVTAADASRASYTFGDPNLAGNYLVTSLFVMAACRRPRSSGLRHLGYLIVLTAIAFTGSNGAMVTLLLGTTLALSVARYRARGVLAGLLTLAATLCVGSLLFAFVSAKVDVNRLRADAASSVPLLRDSVGRSGSTSERATILDEGYHLFLQGDATGLGPGRTKATLAHTQAPYVKEAHNDYLAALLERGVLGEIGLITLGAAALLRCQRLLGGTLPPAFAAAVPRSWLLVTIAPVMAVAGTFYEVEHFRHLWTWLGIVAALALALHDQEVEER